MTFTLPAESVALLSFARPAAVENGFGYLGPDGQVDTSQPIQLWITGRMTHCFALGAIAGVEGCEEMARHGIKALATTLKDPDNPGWFSAINMDGTPASEDKESYAHTFVILAASSALAAGIEEARPLLEDALGNIEKYWWDEEYGMMADRASRDMTRIDPYRGINANMHLTEACLAACSTPGCDQHLNKALRIIDRVVALVAEFDGRLPEHFSSTWVPELEYNRDKPADPFRPFGSTPGHWLEWARLILHARAELQLRGREVPANFLPTAQRLYALAMSEAWAPNEELGFVYTVDFEGKPVVTSRMHWVLCEGIGAAAALRTAISSEGEARDAEVEEERTRYTSDLEMMWAYGYEKFREAPGAWVHELDEMNRPSTTTWSGKPDIYHTLQATIVESVPLAPSFSWALAQM
ncbi:MAG: AGE family epimerase/isomerase [Actinomycetaceae bacterium]|nr:AGE family epimerase/isomerase [Actinomycetaceae bacterium]